MVFKNREDAAEKLAKKLEGFRDENPIILAIPRGGVITGDVIAKALGAKLDILVSRKIGAPNNPELAIGAVMHDGSFFPNSELIQMLQIPQYYIDEEIQSQLKEIERRLVKFRGSKNYDLKGKTVILVDDGIATGATIFVAIQWIKKQNPKRLVVAVPVGPQDTLERLKQIVEVVVLESPYSFGAVGEFYDVFDQVEDYTVATIMNGYGYRPKNIS
ncbi:MAG: phosphoribosyltransferase family protein [Nitrososphaera sp.]